MKLQTIKCKTCNRVFAACKADYIDAEWTAECDRYVKEGNSIVEMISPLTGENVFGDEPLNPCCGKPVLTGIELIAQERKEQIEKHGRTVEFDAQYNTDQLLKAAEILLKPVISPFLQKRRPFGWDRSYWQKLISKPYLERLIIAGSLIAAEIDRIKALKGGSSE